MTDGIIKTPEGWHVLKHDSHLSRWVEEHRTLGVAEGEMPAVERYIPVGGAVLDAGGNIGDHAFSYARRVGLSGSVISAEPNALVFECLRLNFESVPNVQTLNVAFSDKEETLYLDTPTTNIGASYATGAASPTTQEIRCVTIDSLKLPRLDFIHLDVEGFEAKALRGGQATLDRCRPVLFVEINPGHLARNGESEASVRALFASLGYTWVELCPENGPHQPQRDVLGIPRTL